MSDEQIRAKFDELIYAIFYTCKTEEDFRTVQKDLHAFVKDNNLTDAQIQYFFDSNAGEMLSMCV